MADSFAAQLSASAASVLKDSLTLGVALAAITLSACRPRPLPVDGCGNPPPNRNRIRITHRQFRSLDSSRALLVARVESFHPGMALLSDATVTLQALANPGETLAMIPDSANVGSYRHGPMPPGLYVVRVRRIGFFPVVDTVRLAVGWIDSATYRTVVDVICLSALSRSSSISTMPSIGPWK